MSYQSELRNYWNWLPGFRSVAETEHLPTAAKRTHLTAAALSRTVRLLEEELDRPLFQRRGRRLYLNEDGRVLLGAVRMAMRLVHDAQTSIRGRRFDGPVRVAAGGVGRVFAMAAVMRTREEHGGLVPYVLTPSPATVVDQLLHGALDIAVGSFVLRAPGLSTELLCHASSSVYCGPRSALYGRETIELDEVRRHGFTAPPPDVNGASVDGWPPELGRDVRLYVDRLETGREVCGSSELLAVLPDRLAAQSPVPLQALPLGDLIPKTPVVSISREPTGVDDRVQRVLTRLREVAS